METDLLFAAKAGILLDVERLVMNGAIINRRIDDGDWRLAEDEYNLMGCNALHLAASEGHLDVVAYLLEHGAGWYRPTAARRDTALTIAASRGQMQVVQYLIRQGHDVQYAARDGETPLERVVSGGDMEMIHYLMRNGAFDKDHRNHNGESLFHLAAYNGDVDVMRFLVDEGQVADVRAMAMDKVTPLHRAAEFNHVNAVRYLVEQGADIEAIDTSDGDSSLHYAVREGAMDVVHYLIAQGALTDQRNVRTGQTPLLYAASLGKFEAMQFLVLHGADWRMADHRGLTTLIGAILRGRLDAVQYLVDLGVDWNLPDKEDNTPLHYAAGGVLKGYVDPGVFPSLDVLLFLMEECGADLRAINKGGKLPVDVAFNEEIRQAIVDEEVRRCNHTYKRAREADHQPVPAAGDVAEEEEEESEDEESEDEDEED
jgi:ankyrin repeat protein